MRVRIAAALGLAALPAPITSAADAAASEAMAIVRTYCLDCHSTEKQKGDFDLESADIFDDPRAWEHALDQVEVGEMPPKKAEQMTDEEKEALTGWIRRTLGEIALGAAGDPGPVVLRRLSNMEYTYTLRDLTGVDSLDPTREFPVDGAAGEGFTNAGAALVMSPALLIKYLDAAKEVAGHAVFTRHGMRWSAGTSPQDWTDESMAEIRTLYAKYSGSGDGTHTIKQGIELDTGTGEGRIPLKPYLEAVQGRRGTDGLSPKYLALLRDALEGTKPSLLLDPLRAAFRSGSLAADDIEPWQRALWKFENVGMIGPDGKHKAWQEPASPVASSQDFQVKLEGSGDRTLFLTASPVGGRAEAGKIVWEDARLTGPGRPDIPVSDLPALVRHLEDERARILAGAQACLDALSGGDAAADAAQLADWREYLGLNAVRLDAPLTGRVEEAGGYAFVQGWTGGNDLSVLANASDETVRIPGIMLPRSVAVHPSPDRAVMVAWQSAAGGPLQIGGNVVRAHPECGSGITWSLEVLRGQASERLAGGIATDGSPIDFGRFDGIAIEPGQHVALVVGPHNGSHACGLTTVNLTIAQGEKSWDLAADVSPGILTGNSIGPWHFASRPSSAAPPSDLPPALVDWRRDPSPDRAALVRRELEANFPLTHPLLARAMRSFRPGGEPAPLTAAVSSAMAIAIPGALAEGMEFAATVRLAPGSDCGAQVQVLTAPPPAAAPAIRPDLPVLAIDGSEARRRIEAGFDDFRALFPAALCYVRIVPVDEVVTLTLYHREDHQLCRLMLSDDECAALDRMWEDLLFVSEAPLKLVDAYEQIVQYATQDRPDLAEGFAKLNDPIRAAAAEFQKQKESATADQAQAVIDFAARAWRRPLREDEVAALRAFEPRLMLVRVLASPSFLYKAESIPDDSAPVSDLELATRLSYFLWSSAPDDALSEVAAAGRLHEPEAMSEQVRRMMQDPRVARLAREFGCQWLHVRDVATLDEKSERHFPEFSDLRGDMQEEVERFVTDLFRNDRSVLSLLDADYTFVNRRLAGHYGLKADGDGWQRVEGMRDRGRGGILGFAATLAKHSGASRTSAILRGTWLSEVVLGDKLPPPPKGVPVLPDEPPAGLSERQLIERHSSDPNCAACHKRIDPFGYALEGFDAIGRSRDADTATELFDGTKVDGLEDLRAYLLGTRRQDFLEQFCRKLIGYALGRSFQLSDRPLLEAMTGSDLKAGTLIELLVNSRQFREVRGRNQDVVGNQ